jgi:hypothetical protein
MRLTTRQIPEHFRILLETENCAKAGDETGVSSVKAQDEDFCQEAEIW